MELGKKPLTKSRGADAPRCPALSRAIDTDLAFDLTPWKNGLFQKDKERISGNPGA